jgi:hypothetical protein
VPQFFLPRQEPFVFHQSTGESALTCCQRMGPSANSRCAPDEVLILPAAKTLHRVVSRADLEYYRMFFLSRTRWSDECEAQLGHTTVTRYTAHHWQDAFPSLA